MSERLPTVYHGRPRSEADAQIVNDAIQGIVAILNKVPEDEDRPLRVIVSVLVSVCCAQDDPAAAFEIIGANAGAAIQAVIAKPEGSG